MYPEREFMNRFEALLAELDDLSDAQEDDTLEDLNAELEDALFMLSQIKAADADAREALLDTFEEIKALGEDYARLDVGGVGEIARRLMMAADMASNSLEA